MKRILSIALVLSAFIAVSCQKEEVTTGTLRGTLQYDTEDLTGAVVTIKGDQGTFSGEILPEGFFILQNIPAGTYEISCSYNGQACDFYIKNQDKVSTDYFQRMDSYFEDYAEYLEAVEDGDDEAVEPTMPKEPAQLVNDHHVTIEAGNDHLRNLVVPLSEKIVFPVEEDDDDDDE